MKLNTWVHSTNGLTQLYIDDTNFKMCSEAQKNCSWMQSPLYTRAEPIVVKVNDKHFTIFMR